jgi:hypothetical protein
MTTSAGPYYVGQTQTFNVTVSSTGAPAPTGIITFLVNGVQYDPAVALTASSATQSTASYSFTFSASGARTITAQYSGDPTYAPNSTQINQTIQLIPTTTTVTSNSNPAVPYAPVTFFASVGASLGATPTGMVNFYQNGSYLTTEPLVNGVATYSTSFTYPSSMVAHNISAFYVGSSSDASSTSNILAENIVAPGPLSTTTTLSASPGNPPPGTPITFTAQVTSPSGTPTGYIIFIINGVWGSPIALNGSDIAQMTTSFTSNASIGAYYTGDLNFNSSMSNTLNYTISSGNGRLV